MNPVVALYRITKELFDILEQRIQKDNRDEVIVRITKLLNERDQLLPEVRPPFTAEQKGLGTEIVRMNTFIDTQLEITKKEIQIDIAHLKKSKETSNKYTNPYQSPPADGMFFDKKK